MQETIIKRAATASAQTPAATAPFASSQLLVPTEPEDSPQLLVPTEPESPSQLLTPTEPAASKTRKLFIRTFGCQMNEYDSDKMADVLREDQGVELTQNPEEADIILFNTCSVREKAQEKVFSDLGRVQHLKQRNPNLVIGVGGCVASQEGDAIVKRAPYVDIVFGPQTLHRLPELIARRRASGRSQVDISFPEIEKFDAMPPARVDGPTAFVSIMEGCSKYCSFCVVPYTRGAEVSRPFDDVLVEIADLADQGVKEVTLLGQNVNAYRGPMGEGSDIADFAMLLEYVHEVPGIERIRYTTSHPKEMTTRLIDAHGTLPKLVPFLHLPVQAGSDAILIGHEARLHHAGIQVHRAPLARGASGAYLVIGFHHRLSGRNRSGFRKNHGADPRCRIRPVLFLHLFAPPGYARRRPAGRHTQRGQAGTAASPASAYQ